MKVNSLFFHSYLNTNPRSLIYNVSSKYPSEEDYMRTPLVNGFVDDRCCADT